MQRDNKISKYVCENVAEIILFEGIIKVFNRRKMEFL